MPLKSKPSLEEEYFSLQKQFEEANKSLGGMPAGSTALPTPEIRQGKGLFGRILEQAGVPTKGFGLGTMLSPVTVPFAAAQEGIDTALEKLGKQRPVAPGISTPGGTPSMSPGEMATWSVGTGPKTWGSLSRLGLPKAATEITNPILQRALELAKQKALPGGRFTRGVWTPEFKTKSGLEGPMKYSAPQAEKPRFKMPTKTAKAGLVEPTAPPTAKAATPLPPKAEPVDEFNQYLTTVENVSPDVKQHLSSAYAAGGMEALYDAAVEMAKQKKLFVK